MGLGIGEILMAINHHLAFVFPGQGSQSVGMLADIAAQFPEVQRIFDEASAVLNYDLWQMVQAGPAEVLNQTMHTQPALLAASYAIWKIFLSKNSMRPAMLAGHSLGEYTALVCANALTLTDAIKLVSARGQYMQEAVAENKGAMAAIVGLDDEKVSTLCDEVAKSGEVVSPANFNSIGQVVVAGHKKAVEDVVRLAKEQNAKLAMLIPVSVPSHCELMRPAAERLAELLSTLSIQLPNIPVMNNVDATIYSDVHSIRDGLIKQLYHPVRWVQMIQNFVKQGVTTLIECGPNKVLTGLNKRIDKQLTLFSTNDLANLDVVLKLGSD